MTVSGDTCCNPLSLGGLINLIEKSLPDIYVKSLKIGGSFIEEVENGYFMNANLQVKEACEQIASDPQLSNGYNAIGFSQGAQFLRAVAQRCPEPRMKNLISIGGQHQGIYGLPHCAYPDHKWCNYLRIILNKGAYWGWVQNQFVQAEYWHDPTNEEKYKRLSTFIAEINNELHLNATYRDNLKKLERLVLVKFESDTMVQPPETEWFGFYTPGQSLNISSLNTLPIYTEDKLGLKELFESGRLDFISVPGDHLQFSREWFTDVVIGKYLSN